MSSNLIKKSICMNKNTIGDLRTENCGADLFQTLFNMKCSNILVTESASVSTTLLSQFLDKCCNCK